MNLVVKSALTGFVALIGFAHVSSFAQDGGCTCATAYRGPATPIGSIGSVKGDAMVSQTAGYGPATAGNALDFGSRVVVGARGSASVHIGGCSLDVPANSSLDISRVGNNICLKVVGSEQTGAIDPSLGGAGSNLPLYMFGGMAAGAGITAATQDDDNAVSQ
jgi:hypothetical protein